MNTPNLIQKTASEPNRYTHSGSAVSSYQINPVKNEIPTESLHYRISEDCKVTLFFDGRVTQEAIAKLVAHLTLGKDDFPSKSSTQDLSSSDLNQLEAGSPEDEN